MRHRNLKTKLSRTESSRKAVLKNLMRGLFTHERITTTFKMAKVASRHADKVITLAKKNNLAAIRQAEAIFQDRQLISKIFKEIGPRYTNINGGYTRVVKLCHRKGDGAEVAILELTQREIVVETDKGLVAKAGQKVEQSNESGSASPAKTVDASATVNSSSEVSKA